MFDYLRISDRDMLVNHIERKNVAHAYLFYGAEEEQMDLTVQEFIKSIYCTHSRFYCDSCVDCMRIDRGENPDVTHVRRDGKNIRIKQIRNLQYEATLSASEYEYNIFVIHMAEAMNQEAANAFLKTLEEPEENTVMILTAASREVILPTIISRCIPIKVLSRDNPDELQDSEKLYVLENMAQIASGNSMNLVAVATKLAKDRDRANATLLFIMKFLTDVMIFKESKRDLEESGEDYLRLVGEINGKITAERLSSLIELAMQIYEAVQHNVSMKSAFINLFIGVEEASR